MNQSIKLSKLRLSPINVRTRPDDQLKIPEMAATIQGHGLLKNILVRAVSKPRGTFEVLDGGRRYRALMLLVERGVIDAATYEVPSKVLEGDEAMLSEVSTIVNNSHLDLTPAEECRAFQHFIGLHGDIDGVAKRFGVTRRFVEGRLRLAALAEPIFDALSNGDITLDLAKAFASTENQQKQLLVWNSYDTTHASADTIRRAIANESMKASDPVAILVGQERYIAAGGKVDPDLFSEDGDRWIDPEVAHRLAGDIMEAEAKRVGEELGIAWIRPIATAYTHSAAQGLYRAILPQPDLTQEQQQHLDHILERRSAINEQMEDETLEEEAWRLLKAEDDRLFADLREIENRAPVLPDSYKPLVGAFLTLQPNGQMKLDSCYYSEQPIRTEAEEDGEGGGDSATIRRPTVGLPSAPERPRAPEAVAPDGKALSARLADELAVQRRDVLGAALLGDPALALDYAIFCMAQSRTQDDQSAGSTIVAAAPQDPATAGVPGSRARDYLVEAMDGLDAGWAGHPCVVDRFEAFRALSDDSKVAWLAYLTAVSLVARTGQNPLHNRLATILDVNCALWWRPTAENYFDRISKGSTLALLNDVGGPAIMARHATLKKGELSGSCEKLFAGASIVEPEVKEAALAWVPDAMRFLDKPSGSAEPIVPSEAELSEAAEPIAQADDTGCEDEESEEIDEAAQAA
ncbi:ParB N-terminal domain-containing protein (plasmid) [Sphingobium fuliginis]|uniref:ParB N-terminal domain-containing protein n=2 Tax=Sphingobium fuliginis (strain ATCC 27551) TaxID=336203 RepID=A0A7M2GQD8_SPHSA|nr:MULTISPECIES: ParB/RepB/Spo0J family partition protein [Sphingobium]QOT74555.1 ParB N-terminal domain-containing protein [Sphingobium fuliginis]